MPKKRHKPEEIVAKLRQVDWWIGLAALLGLILVLARRPSGPVLVLLGSGVLYMLLMGLSHWETRYYLYILVIYVGLACHALALVVGAVLGRRWLSRPAAAVGGWSRLRMLGCLRSIGDGETPALGTSRARSIAEDTWRAPTHPSRRCSSRPTRCSSTGRATAD